MRGVQRVLFNGRMIRYESGNSSDERPTAMRITLPLMICAALTASGCATISESRFNPLNWMEQSTNARTSDGALRPLVPNTGTTQIVDARSLVQSVSAVSVERLTNGVMIRATGIGSSVGQYNAQLVPVSNTGGVLTLAFRIENAGGGAGSAQSRQITAARVLKFAELSGVRSVRVQANSNQRTVRVR